MNPVDAIIAIRQHYDTEVVNGNPTKPFVTEFDNQPVTDATGKVIDKPSGNWVRFTIRISQALQVEAGGVGNNTHRHLGMCIAKVNTPVDKGDVDTWYISQFIKSKFLSKIVGLHVRFSTPTIKVIGREGDSWCHTVTCPFHFDEIG